MSPNTSGGASTSDRLQPFIPVILGRMTRKAWSKVKMSSFEYVELEAGDREDKGGDCDIFLLNSLTFTLSQKTVSRLSLTQYHRNYDPVSPSQNSNKY